MSAIRLGTRRSTLALAQSGMVADAVAAATGREVELVPIVSEGDVSRASLREIGGRGVFASRLREALLAGECDMLVHSLKDLPTAAVPGLVLAATPAREDARDVVVTRGAHGLEHLSRDAEVGTGSPRRIAQVRRHNPRVRVRDLRGNVDSRLNRVRSGELDAVVLAAAGLERLGMPDDLALEYRGLREWPTAPGQGALAIETTEAAGLAAELAVLDDLPTRIAVTAERAVLAGLDAGCTFPIGVHAEVVGAALRVVSAVYHDERRITDDSTESLDAGYIRSQGSGDGADAADEAEDPIARAAAIGEAIAHRLLERGAADPAPREPSL